jgi:hypothetical protein
MKQFLLTPAAGKRLIGRAMAIHPAIKSVLKSGTLAIIAGTTNGYVAEEILSSIGQLDGFSRKRFFRGINLPPWIPTTESGMLQDMGDFPGDVIIVKGVWKKGETILNAANGLVEGDIVLKGANALDLIRRQAAIYIGHPKAGTIGIALQAVVGRRVRLMMPVGLEKRVVGDLHDLALRLNSPGGQGQRLLPVPGETFTELDAIYLLTGAKAELVAGGGVCGAEGCVWVMVDGDVDQMRSVEELMKSVYSEREFEI